MWVQEITLENEAATLQWGNAFAQQLPTDALIFLRGELGAGKTTLVRGLLRGLGYAGPVKSPTYTIVEPYELNGLSVAHFDLYRIADPEELSLIGADEILALPGIKCIEWPERALSWLPEADIELRLKVCDSGRQLRVTGNFE